MEGGYAFICKMQSSETLVSPCVARCLCKHMNKNKNEQENGIYLAHAYNNGVREGLITLEPLAMIHICVQSVYTNTQLLLAVSSHCYSVSPFIFMSGNPTYQASCSVSEKHLHIFLNVYIIY